MSADIADMLDNAADVIVERGWCQRKFEDTNGGVCVDGAIRVATTGVPWTRYVAGTDRAHEAMQRHAGIDNVLLWNDEPGRTADEVITALRDCAAAERDRHA